MEEVKNRLTFFKYIIADMSPTQEAITKIPWYAVRRPIQLVDIIFRGCGQVVGMNNTLTGILIVAALFWNNWWTALCGMVGVIFSTATAIMLSIDEGPINNGIYGYNGFLVGLGIGTFGADQDWILFVPSAFVAVISTVSSR